MQQRYYRFERTYQVPANSRYEARVKFSRALEERVEDRYYVGTNIDITQRGRIGTSRVSKLIDILGWFLSEAYNQIAGYPKYNRHY